MAQTAHKAGSQSGRAVVVNARTAIVLSSDVKGPVRLAAQDLASDLQKVFGVEPKIVANVGDAGASAIVVHEATGGSRPAESF